jgi:hypothetical protein
LQNHKLPPSNCNEGESINIINGVIIRSDKITPKAHPKGAPKSNDENAAPPSVEPQVYHTNKWWKAQANEDTTRAASQMKLVEALLKKAESVLKEREAKKEKLWDELLHNKDGAQKRFNETANSKEMAIAEMQSNATQASKAEAAYMTEMEAAAKTELDAASERLDSMKEMVGAAKAYVQKAREAYERAQATVDTVEKFRAAAEARADNDALVQLKAEVVKASQVSQETCQKLTDADVRYKKTVGRWNAADKAAADMEKVMPPDKKPNKSKEKVPPIEELDAQFVETLFGKLSEVETKRKKEADRDKRNIISQLQKIQRQQLQDLQGVQTRLAGMQSKIDELSTRTEDTLQSAEDKLGSALNRQSAQKQEAAEKEKAHEAAKDILDEATANVANLTDDISNQLEAATEQQMKRLSLKAEHAIELPRANERAARADADAAQIRSAAADEVTDKANRVVGVAQIASGKVDEVVEAARSAFDAVNAALEATTTALEATGTALKAPAGSLDESVWLNANDLAKKAAIMVEALAESMENAFVEESKAADALTEFEEKLDNEMTERDTLTAEFDAEERAIKALTTPKDALSAELELFSDDAAPAFENQLSSTFKTARNKAKSSASSAERDRAAEYVTAARNNLEKAMDDLNDAEDRGDPAEIKRLQKQTDVLYAKITAANKNQEAEEKELTASIMHNLAERLQVKIDAYNDRVQKGTITPYMSPEAMAKALEVVALARRWTAVAIEAASKQQDVASEADKEVQELELKLTQAGKTQVEEMSELVPLAAANAEAVSKKMERMAEAEKIETAVSLASTGFIDDACDKLEPLYEQYKTAGNAAGCKVITSAMLETVPDVLRLSSTTIQNLHKLTNTFNMPPEDVKQKVLEVVGEYAEAGTKKGIRNISRVLITFERNVFTVFEALETNGALTSENASEMLSDVVAEEIKTAAGLVRPEFTESIDAACRIVRPLYEHYKALYEQYKAAGDLDRSAENYEKCQAITSAMLETVPKLLRAASEKQGLASLADASGISPEAIAQKASEVCKEYVEEKDTDNALRVLIDFKQNGFAIVAALKADGSLTQDEAADMTSSFKNNAIETIVELGLRDDRFPEAVESSKRFGLIDATGSVIDSELQTQMLEGTTTPEGTKLEGVVTKLEKNKINSDNLYCAIAGFGLKADVVREKLSESAKQSSEQNFERARQKAILIISNKSKAGTVSSMGDIPRIAHGFDVEFDDLPQVTPSADAPSPQCLVLKNVAAPVEDSPEGRVAALRAASALGLTTDMVASKLTDPAIMGKKSVMDEVHAEVAILRASLDEVTARAETLQRTAAESSRTHTAKAETKAMAQKNAEEAAEEAEAEKDRRVAELMGQLADAQDEDARHKIAQEISDTAFTTFVPKVQVKSATAAAKAEKLRSDTVNTILKQANTTLDLTDKASKSVRSASKAAEALTAADKAADDDPTSPKLTKVAVTKYGEAKQKLREAKNSVEVVAASLTELEAAQSKEETASALEPLHAVAFSIAFNGAMSELTAGIQRAASPVILNGQSETAFKEAFGDMLGELTVGIQGVLSAAAKAAVQETHEASEEALAKKEEDASALEEWLDTDFKGVLLGAFSQLTGDAPRAIGQAILEITANAELDAATQAYEDALANADPAQIEQLQKHVDVAKAAYVAAVEYTKALALEREAEIVDLMAADLQKAADDPSKPPEAKAEALDVAALAWSMNAEAHTATPEQNKVAAEAKEWAEKLKHEEVSEPEAAKTGAGASKLSARQEEWLQAARQEAKMLPSEHHKLEAALSKESDKITECKNAIEELEAAKEDATLDSASVEHLEQQVEVFKAEVSAAHEQTKAEIYKIREARAQRVVNFLEKLYELESDSHKAEVSEVLSLAQSRSEAARRAASLQQEIAADADLTAKELARAEAGGAGKVQAEEEGLTKLGPSAEESTELSEAEKLKEYGKEADEELSALDRELRELDNNPEKKDEYLKGLHDFLSEAEEGFLSSTTEEDMAEVNRLLDLGDISGAKEFASTLNAKKRDVMTDIELFLDAKNARRAKEWISVFDLNKEDAMLEIKTLLDAKNARRAKEWILLFDMEESDGVPEIKKLLAIGDAIGAKRLASAFDIPDEEFTAIAAEASVGQPEELEEEIEEEAVPKVEQVEQPEELFEEQPVELTEGLEVTEEALQGEEEITEEQENVQNEDINIFLPPDQKPFISRMMSKLRDIMSPGPMPLIKTNPQHNIEKMSGVVELINYLADAKKTIDESVVKVEQGKLDIYLMPYNEATTKAENLLEEWDTASKQFTHADKVLAKYFALDAAGVELVSEDAANEAKKQINADILENQKELKELNELKSAKHPDRITILIKQSEYEEHKEAIAIHQECLQAYLDAGANVHAGQVALTAVVAAADARLTDASDAYDAALAEKKAIRVENSTPGTESYANITAALEKKARSQEISAKLQTIIAAYNGNGDLAAGALTGVFKGVQDQIDYAHDYAAHQNRWDQYVKAIKNDVPEELKGAKDSLETIYKLFGWHGDIQHWRHGIKSALDSDAAELNKLADMQKKSASHKVAAWQYGHQKRTIASAETRVIHDVESLIDPDVITDDVLEAFTKVGEAIASTTVTSQILKKIDRESIPDAFKFATSMLKPNDYLLKSGPSGKVAVPVAPKNALITSAVVKQFKGAIDPAYPDKFLAQYEAMAARWGGVPDALHDATVEAIADLKSKGTQTEDAFKPYAAVLQQYLQHANPLTDESREKLKQRVDDVLMEYETNNPNAVLHAELMYLEAKGMYFQDTTEPSTGNAGTFETIYKVRKLEAELSAAGNGIESVRAWVLAGPDFIDETKKKAKPGALDVGLPLAPEFA